MTSSIQLLIQTYPDKPWNWRELSSRSDIPLEFVEENLSLSWDWKKISGRPDLTPPFVENHPAEEWDWWTISSHKNFQDEDIERFINSDIFTWDWATISRIPRFIKYIETYPDKPWDLDIAADNPALPIEYVEGNLDKVWDWGRLSKNQKLTTKFIMDNEEAPWDWDELSRNKFIKKVEHGGGNGKKEVVEREEKETPEKTPDEKEKPPEKGEKS
jgi:hypothetical protein